MMEMIHLDLLDLNEVGFNSSAKALRSLRTQLTPWTVREMNFTS